MSKLSRKLEQLLFGLAAALLGLLVFIVILAVICRKFGNALIWYDELASIVLVWLTYVGAAVAALQRAHLGFEGLVNRMGKNYRFFFFLIGEGLVIAFFLIVAIYGFKVQAALQGETLVSLPWFPLMVSQAIIPVSALLFIFAEVLTIPKMIRALRR